MIRRAVRSARGWWRVACAWEEVRHARRMLVYCPCCVCRDIIEKGR